MQAVMDASHRRLTTAFSVNPFSMHHQACHVVLPGLCLPRSCRHMSLMRWRCTLMRMGCTQLCMHAPSGASAAAYLTIKCSSACGGSWAPSALLGAPIHSSLSIALHSEKYINTTLNRHAAMLNECISDQQRSQDHDLEVHHMQLVKHQERRVHGNLMQDRSFVFCDPQHCPPY